MDVDLKKLLEDRGLHRPTIWAGIRGDRDRLVATLNVLGLLDTEPHVVTTRVDACTELQRAARPIGDTFAAGLARQSALQVSVDVAEAAKRRRLEKEESLLAKARATRVYHKPVEWKGKRYLRAELTGDEHARKKAEDAEREKWARRVFRILVDAHLPFGLAAQAKNWSH